MKKWQESRDYRRVRDENGQVVANIITIDGIDVEVSEEVFLAYSQMDRRERYIKEEVEKGKVLSLDKLLEDGIPLEQLGVNPIDSVESAVIQSQDALLAEKLKKRMKPALAALDESERQLVQALFFDGISAREYAKQLGVYHRTILYRRDKILGKLRQKILL